MRRTYLCRSLRLEEFDQSQPSPIKESLTWLKEGQFADRLPVGRGLQLDRRTPWVRDPAWSPIAALVRKTDATVVPMYFPGHNGFLFNLVGLIHPRFRTLLLPRYIANKKGRTLTLRIGTPLTTKALEPFSTDDVQLIKYMRFRSYLLAERETHRTRRFITLNPPMMPPDPIIAPIPADVLTAEIARLPEALDRLRRPAPVIAAAGRSPPACEIGRLLPSAFRRGRHGNAIDPTTSTTQPPLHLERRP